MLLWLMIVIYFLSQISLSRVLNLLPFSLYLSPLAMIFSNIVCFSFQIFCSKNYVPLLILVSLIATDHLFQCGVYIGSYFLCLCNYLWLILSLIVQINFVNTVRVCIIWYSTIIATMCIQVALPFVSFTAVFIPISYWKSLFGGTFCWSFWDEGGNQFVFL